MKSLYNNKKSNIFFRAYFFLLEMKNLRTQFFLRTEKFAHKNLCVKKFAHGKIGFGKVCNRAVLDNAVYRRIIAVLSSAYRLVSPVWDGIVYRNPHRFRVRTVGAVLTHTTPAR